MEGVSICSPLCQHPSCWLALRRSLVKGTGQAQGEANRCSHPVTRDSNADKTTDDGSLPVVKVWDLLETYARSSIGLPEDFNSPWSYQPSPVDKKKRYEKWKQKKVKKQDREQTIKSNLTSTSTASFQVLAPELPDASSRKQFYTWVPPSSTRKPLHIPAKKPKEVHVRDLTGELMPSDMASKHVCRVHRKSNRSQEGNYEAHGYWSRVLNKIYGYRLDDMLNMPEQVLLRILKSAAHSQGSCEYPNPLELHDPTALKSMSQPPPSIGGAKKQPPSFSLQRRVSPSDGSGCPRRPRVKLPRINITVPREKKCSMICSDVGGGGGRTTSVFPLGSSSGGGGGGLPPITKKPFLYGKRDTMDVALGPVRNAKGAPLRMVKFSIADFVLQDQDGGRTEPIPGRPLKSSSTGRQESMHVLGVARSRRYAEDSATQQVVPPNTPFIERVAVATDAVAVAMEAEDYDNPAPSPAENNRREEVAPPPNTPREERPLTVTVSGSALLVAIARLSTMCVPPGGAEETQGGAGNAREGNAATPGGAGARRADEETLDGANAVAEVASSSHNEKTAANEKKSSNEQPVKEQPPKEQPADEQPVKEQPAKEPVDEQPPHGQPANEQLLEEQPVNEQPPKELPVDEQPLVDEVFDGMGFAPPAFEGCDDGEEGVPEGAGCRSTSLTKRASEGGFTISADPPDNLSDLSEEM